MRALILVLQERKTRFTNWERGTGESPLLKPLTSPTDAERPRISVFKYPNALELTLNLTGTIWIGLVRENIIAQQIMFQMVVTWIFNIFQQHRFKRVANPSLT